MSKPDPIAEVAALSEYMSDVLRRASLIVGQLEELLTTASYTLQTGSDELKRKVAKPEDQVSR